MSPDGANFLRKKCLEVRVVSMQNISLSALLRSALEPFEILRYDAKFAELQRWTEKSWEANILHGSYPDS